MMQDEYESAFVLKYNDASQLIENPDRSEEIVDYYFDENVRIRKQGNSYFNTFKRGKKSSGHREEISVGITPDSTKYDEFLQDTAKFIVRKKRFYSKIEDGFMLSIDLVESPMKIGIVELETFNADTFERVESLIKKSNLVVCPLNAWNYFKRKIGFAGGDSSGKTTMAKHIAMVLNIEYDANASDVVEYATSFIQKNGRIPSFEDQAWIQAKQEDREAAVASTANIVLSDSPPPLGYLYAQRALSTEKHTEHSDFAIKSLYKRTVKALQEYDMIFVMATRDYKDNGVRYNNRSLSVAMYGDIIKFMENHARSHMMYKTDYTEKDEILNTILYLNNLEDVQNLLSNISKKDNNVVV